MDEYYNITAQSYNELYGREQLNKINLIKSNISINKNDKLLDVGCGTGISSDFDCFCVGVDSSIKLLKQNKKAKVLALAEHLPFKNNSFDIVVSVTALHNFYEPKKALEEMKRVGKRAFIFSVLKKRENLKNKSFEMQSISNVLRNQEISDISGVHKDKFYEQSKKFNKIRSDINRLFDVKKVIKDDKDVIFVI